MQLYINVHISNVCITIDNCINLWSSRKYMFCDYLTGGHDRFQQGKETAMNNKDINSQCSDSMAIGVVWPCHVDEIHLLRRQLKPRHRLRHCQRTDTVLPISCMSSSPGGRSKHLTVRSYFPTVFIENLWHSGKPLALVIYNQLEYKVHFLQHASPFCLQQNIYYFLNSESA